jgi:class 3 adenylate cyclase
MVVDAEGSDSRPDPLLMVLRNSLYGVIEDALAKAAIPMRRRVVEDRGDGVLVIVDAAVPKIDLVDPMLKHLVAGLGVHNQNNPLDRWLRLRVALHSGDVRRDARGWGGHDLTHTFRLSQAEAVKRCLVLAARAQCVLVTSDHFYRSVIEHGDRGIDPTSFRSVDISQPRGPSTGWVHVPGYATPPIDVPSPPPRARERLGTGHGHGFMAKSMFFDVVNIGHDFNS